jgi:hypothetical protein
MSHQPPPHMPERCAEGLSGSILLRLIRFIYVGRFDQKLAVQRPFPSLSSWSPSCSAPRPPCCIPRSAARSLKSLCIPDSAHSAYSARLRPLRVFRKKKTLPAARGERAPLGVWLSNRSLATRAEPPLKQSDFEPRACGSGCLMPLML